MLILFLVALPFILLFLVLPVCMALMLILFFLYISYQFASYLWAMVYFSVPRRKIKELFTTIKKGFDKL